MIQLPILSLSAYITSPKIRYTFFYSNFTYIYVQDIQQKLREEVISILGDDPHSETPTLEELKKMKYMNMVIKEVIKNISKFVLILSKESSSQWTCRFSLFSQDC